MGYRQHGWRHHPETGTDPITIPASAGGDLPWARQKVDDVDPTAPQTSSVLFHSDYYSFTTSDATVFELSGHAIEVLQNGVYSITGRIFWDTYPTADYTVGISGIDPDGHEDYMIAIAQSDRLNEDSGPAFGLPHVRLAAGQVLYPFVSLAAADEPRGLYIGTFWEILKLGTADLSDRTF